MKNESVFQFLTTDELVDWLTRAGYSNTRARRAVIEALSAAEGPATPADLLQVGRVQHQALGLVTVYRTLEILETLGLVRKLHLAEGCDIDAVINSAQAQTGFAAQGHWLEIFGLCPTCQEKQA